MKLTWKDGVSTGLVALGLLMAVAAVQGWGWPLLSGVRAGILALGIVGLAACVLGGSLDRFYYTDPFGLMTSVIAMGSMALAIVGGLIFGTQEFVIVLAAVTTMLWVLATLRHAVEAAPINGRRMLS